MSEASEISAKNTAGQYYGEFHSRKAFAVTVFAAAASAVVVWAALFPGDGFSFGRATEHWRLVLRFLLLIVMLPVFWLFAPAYARLRAIPKGWKAEGNRSMRLLYAGLACVLGLALPAFVAAFAARLILSACGGLALPGR